MAKGSSPTNKTELSDAGLRDVGFLLRQAAAAHRMRVEQALHDIDVTPAQYIVLSVLNAFPGISNADLARVTALTPQTVNLIVARLGRRGFIERMQHSRHGRILHLVLTQTGRVLAGQCRERVTVVEGDLEGTIPSRHKAALIDWLETLAATDAHSG